MRTRFPQFGIAAVLLTVSTMFGDEPTPKTENVGRPIIQRLIPTISDTADPSTLPTDQQVVRRISEAKRLLEEKQYSHGMALLQLVLDEPVDSYVQNGSNWLRARQFAEETITQLGPQGWKIYQLQYSGQAEQLLQEAVAARDLGGLAEVMQRFFLTPAGFQAANILAQHQLDRGRPGLAAIYLVRMLQCPVHSERVNAALVAKYAVALSLSNREQKAGETLDTAKQPIPLGGGTWSAAELLRAITRRPETESDLSSPWTVFQGNPQRTGFARGDMPLLAPEWSHPISRDPETLGFLEEILDHYDALPIRRPTLFSIYPVVAGNALVFRDMHGTSAVDPKTGQIRWTYAEGGSIELEMKANRIRRTGGGNQQANIEGMIVSNSVYGTLSTDGHRLYLIDQLLINPALGAVHQGFAPSNRNNAGELPRNRSSNRLTALDVQTGQPVWHVGGSGTDTNDPLPDTYFFGPPLPIDDMLYVVGEERSELRLFCLAAESGKLLWSQVLALSERRIDVDLFRRSLACHLAYKDGILICPTNLFRVVAVDPLTRSVLWEYDFSEDRPPNQSRYVSGMSVIPPPEVTFANDAPAIAQGIVVISSASGRMLHGVSLQTGERLWTADRRNEYYVSGIYGDRLLLVGGSHVRALSLNTGKTLWSCNVPLPAGRGICMGDRYLLPTAEGSVLSIDLAEGKVTETVRGRRYVPIGNLLFGDRQVVAAGPSGIESFPMFADIEREVAQRLADNPTDPVGLYRRAQLHVSRSQAFAALADLRLALHQDQPASQSLDLRNLLFEIAGREALAQPDKVGDILPDLLRLASNKDQKAIYYRLLAEYHLTQSDYDQALAAVDAHDQLSNKSPVVDKTDMVRMEKRTWSRAFLRRLEAQAVAEKASLPKQLEQRLADANEFATLEQVAFLLGETSLGLQASLKLARMYLEAGRLSEAELVLLQIADLEDSSTAQAAGLLAEISSRAGLKEDARHFQDLTQAPVGSQDPSSTQLTSWNFDTVAATFERTRSYNRTQIIEVQKPVALPYFAKHSLSFDFRDFQVQITDRQTGTRQWYVPLPRSSNYKVSPSFAHLGHLAMFTQHDTLFAVSALERKLLWERKLTPGTVRPSNLNTSYVIFSSSDGRRRPPVDVGPCGPGFVVVRGINDLQVLDPRTGDLLWKRRKVRKGDEVFGDHEVLFVVSADSSYVAHRTSDGEVLREGSFKSVLPFNVQTRGRNLLVYKRDGDRQKAALWDAWTERERWTRHFPSSTRLCSGDEDTLVLLQPDATLFVLDQNDGSVLLKDEVRSEKDRPFSVHVFRDVQNLYVSVDEQGSANVFPFNISNTNIETQPVNGVLRAYDRKTKDRLWEKKLEPTRIVTSPGTELPVLVAIRNEVLKRGQLGTRVKILDKRTGETLHEEERPEYTPFSEFAYHGVEKWIELRAYNLRLRFDFLTEAQARHREEIRSRPNLGTLFDRLRKAMTDQMKDRGDENTPPPP